MLHQSARSRLLPVERPKLAADAADYDWARAYVEIADALPGGRRSLGAHSLRVTKAAAGMYSPRIGDFVHLASIPGADVSRIVAVIEQGLAAVRGAAPTGKLALCAATLAREAGEAVAATFEYVSEPTVERGRKAMKELADVDTLADGLRNEIGALNHAHRQQTWSVVARLRPTTPEPGTRR